jgi:hypothetical protein
MRATADHQLAFSILRRPTDEGAVFQYRYGLNDVRDARGKVFDLVSGQVVENAI